MPRKEKKSRKLSPFLNFVEKHDGVSIHLNILCFCTIKEGQMYLASVINTSIATEFQVASNEFNLFPAEKLTLKAPFTTAADGIHKNFFIVFQ